ncbi:hypothetical protein [uncultured Chloroflexus sp.]|uniref:hypothetical protein n=1 Tax=uncultured Chloroflexus sp. TaxID=214040 RepID=UPI0026183549|nr:hypothetical protein [uncultured Chloroflexus sp.]
MNTVAAIPAQLRQYATAIIAEQEQLLAEARSLATVLSRFSSRCREYAVSGVDGLSDSLFSHCRAINEVAVWVGDTANRIEAADRGGITAPLLGATVAMMSAGIANRLAGRRPFWPGLPTLDLGARLAFRFIWELRAPARPIAPASLGVRIAARLATQWSMQTVRRWNPTWLSGVWPALRTGAVQQGRWLAQAGLVTIAPWLPWPTALRLIATQQWLEQALEHLQMWLMPITLLPQPGWPVRFPLAGFGALAGWFAPLVWQATPILLSPAMQQRLADACTELVQRGTRLVWQSAYQQTMRWLWPWLPLLPNRAQSWHLLQQSLVMSGTIATSRADLALHPAMLWLICVQAGGMLGLISGPRLPAIIQNPADVPKLLESGFWIDAFQYLSLEEMRALVSQLEQLNRNTRFNLMLRPLTRPTTGPEAEPDGYADVHAVFPPNECMVDPNRPYRITPRALQATPHSLISPYLGEEVRAARVGKDEYVVGISGLNLDNMAYGTNGLVSVIETASGKERLDHNAYYQTVRERIMRLIEQMPAGSTLHLMGHSMGGGMCILLSNDPVVQAALAQRQVQLASVITLGAVRPHGEWDDAPSEINGQLVTVRHYVDSDDTLAKSVGAGHDDARYRAVVFELDNHQLDQPSVAHSAYETFDYSRLPVEAQTLPFTIDPTEFELLPLPILPELPPVDPDWFQEPPLSA